MKNYKQNKLTFFVFLVFSFLIISPPLFASTSDGTIDPTYKYAWGENVGFIDFGSTAGNIHITDTDLSGSAYGENIGWINLSTVTNNNEGTLSGYAWGENVGFIDFSKVTIGTDGIFSGSAYGENIGWITFGTTNNKVMTDYRPASSRTSTSSSHSSGGSYLPGYGPKVIPPAIPPIVPIIPTEGCAPGNLFNTTTGNSCTISSTIISGCDNRNTGFSITTGQSCVGNPLTSIPLILTRTLKLTIPYMKGDDVKYLQTYLNTHAYNSGISDGIFGKLTKQAVILFQKANNLTPDGIVGPITRSYIK